MASNVRYANRALRNKHRDRLKSMGCECGICRGKLGPIHYDEPSDYQHPLSFVVDEIIQFLDIQKVGMSQLVKLQKILIICKLLIIIAIH